MKTFTFLLLALAIPTASASTTEVSWGFDVADASVQIDVGDTVKWMWDQKTISKHDLISGTRPAGNDLFKTDLESEGYVFSHTFNESGVFPYFCSPHVNMEAMITVVAKSATCDTHICTAGVLKASPEIYSGANNVRCCDGLTIVEYLVGDRAFLDDIFTGLLIKASLIGDLRGNGPFTVFVPFDSAFYTYASAVAGVVGKLQSPANLASLITLLGYHIADGRMDTSDLTDGQNIQTQQGNDVAVTKSPTGAVKINGVSVLFTIRSISNGVLHFIDGVLLPPDLSSEFQLGGGGGGGNAGGVASSSSSAAADSSSSSSAAAGGNAGVASSSSSAAADSSSSAAADSSSSASAAAEPDSSSSAAAEPDSSSSAAAASTVASAAFNVSPTTKIAMITLLTAAVQFFGPQ